jgi:hypothetical protein
MENLALKITPEDALRLGISVFTKLGKLETPAIVYLETLEGDSKECELMITAAAKEGLIKQHTAGFLGSRRDCGPRLMISITLFLLMPRLRPIGR